MIDQIQGVGRIFEVSVRCSSRSFGKDITIQYLFILRSKNFSLAFPRGWIHGYTALLCDV